MNTPYRCGGCGIFFLAPAALQEHVQHAEGWHYESALYRPSEGAPSITDMKPGNWLARVERFSREEFRERYTGSKEAFERML
jgi:hypothetical protein